MARLQLKTQCEDGRMPPQYQFYVALLLDKKVVFGVKDLEAVNFTFSINKLKRSG